MSSSGVLRPKHTRFKYDWSIDTLPSDFRSMRISFSEGQQVSFIARKFFIISVKCSANLNQLEASCLKNETKGLEQ